MNEKPPPYPTLTTTYSTPADYGMNSQPGSVPPPPPPAGVATMTTTTTTGHTVVAMQPKRIFSRHPASVVCQHCGVNVVTRPRAEVGTVTWLAAGFLILVGCWLGCCLIPFCIDECKDIYHDCPNCQRTVEVYKPL